MTVLTEPILLTENYSTLKGVNIASYVQGGRVRGYKTDR